MPSLPERPTIRNKVIKNASAFSFEQEMDDFLKGLDSYSIQYKPVGTRANLMYTALITYQEIPKVQNNVEGD